MVGMNYELIFSEKNCYHKLVKLEKWTGIIVAALVDLLPTILYITRLPNKGVICQDINSYMYLYP